MSDGLFPAPGRCNDCHILWPDVEAFDIYCVLDPDHEGLHTDGDYEWDD